MNEWEEKFKALLKGMNREDLIDKSVEELYRFGQTRRFRTEEQYEQDLINSVGV